MGAAVPPHVLSERNDRRREMNGLFTLLQRVLPTPSTASSGVSGSAREYHRTVSLDLPQIENKAATATLSVLADKPGVFLVCLVSCSDCSCT